MLLLLILPITHKVKLWPYVFNLDLPFCLYQHGYQHPYISSKTYVPVSASEVFLILLLLPVVMFFLIFYFHLTTNKTPFKFPFEKVSAIIFLSRNDLLSFGPYQ